VALVALVVLAGTACSGDDGGDGERVVFDFSGTAATVDGVTVPAQALGDQIAAFRAAPAAVKPAFGQDEITQTGSDQPLPGIVAALLSTEIYVRIIQGEVAARGLQVGDDLRDVALTQIQAQFGDSLDAAPALKEQIVSRFAAYVTLDRALTPPPPDEAAIQAAYAKDPSRWEQVCARHILVADEAKANDLLAQLRSGSDFATLAKANSTDTGSGANGGDLGCVPRGKYVEPFEKAVWEGPVGEVQGPVKSEFGYHLILVSKRGTLTLDEARDQILSELSPPAFQPLSDWLKTKMPGVKVTVDPRFGTWDAAAAEVTPVGVRTDGLQMGTDPPATTDTTVATTATTSG
jgi:parvulin-like peptidyl-prolyl isomerase